MHGVAATQRLGAEAYSRVKTEQVYDALMRKTSQALAARRAVIVDAVFSNDTLSSKSLAKHSARSRVSGLVPHPTCCFSRVAGRSGDGSDADATVVKQQLAYDTGPVSWTLIDACGVPETVQARAEKLLAANSGAPPAG